jgi:hypothetical protein
MALCRFCFGILECWNDGMVAAWMHGCMGAWVHEIMQSCSHSVMQNYNSCQYYFAVANYRDLEYNLEK